MKIKIILLGFLVALFAACDPTESKKDLGTLLTSADLKFATPFGEDQNTVILQNLTSNVIPIWDYSTGISQRQIDTVHFAFKGDYKIKFSALTAGGLVKGDSVIVHILQDNYNYVKDPLWAALTGGIGNEKVWYLDLDKDNVCRYFEGPMFFAGTNIIWGMKNNGPDNWNWNADRKGNSWIMPTGDYGSITFGLKGGAKVSSVHSMIPARGTENGTFYLDVASKKLTLNNAAILHDADRDGQVTKWGDITLISLTETNMQLAVLRNNPNPGDGPCLLIYNFITKSYRDSWVKPITSDPNFNFGDQVALLTTSNTKVWKPDTNVPYNWMGLEANLLNDWKTTADIVKTGWAPFTIDDIKNIDGVSLAFSDDGTVVFTTDEGTKTKGTYDLNAKTNMLTFKDVTPAYNIAGWKSASTSAKNQWKIMKTEKNEAGIVNGIWFGSRSVEKNEYEVYHFNLASKK